MKNKGLVCSVVMALCAFSAGVAWGFTEGAVNNFFGTGAGAVTTGTFNTFMGGAAGSANTTGEHNTFIGAQAGALTTTGSDNTFLGFNAGGANPTGASGTLSWGPLPVSTTPGV